MFIGLAGTAAASGIACAIYEWHVSRADVILDHVKCFYLSGRTMSNLNVFQFIFILVTS